MNLSGLYQRGRIWDQNQPNLCLSVCLTAFVYIVLLTCFNWKIPRRDQLSELGGWNGKWYHSVPCPPSFCRFFHVQLWLLTAGTHLHWSYKFRDQHLRVNWTWQQFVWVCYVSLGSAYGCNQSAFDICISYIVFILLHFLARFTAPDSSLVFHRAFLRSWMIVTSLGLLLSLPLSSFSLFSSLSCVADLTLSLLSALH